MGANEAALQLGSELEGNVAGGKGTEPGGDAVYRHWVVGECFDAGPTRGHGGKGIVTDRHRGVEARNAHDIGHGARSDTNDDGSHES
jgi:hypothetical protein